MQIPWAECEQMLRDAIIARYKGIDLTGAQMSYWRNYTYEGAGSAVMDVEWVEMEKDI